MLRKAAASGLRLACRANAELAESAVRSLACSHCGSSTSASLQGNSHASTTSSSSSYLLPRTWRHNFSSAPEDVPEVRVPGAGNERVQKVVKDILALNLLEVSDLIEILSKELGVAIPAAGNFMAAAPAPAAAGAAAEAAPPAEEKTEFDVKLDGFEAASKIKVIKEIRGVLPELGLKEAKELVEKSPTVIKTGMKKEEAEALKKKLEAVGGKISLE